MTRSDISSAQALRVALDEVLSATPMEAFRRLPSSPSGYASVVNNTLSGSYYVHGWEPPWQNDRPVDDVRISRRWKRTLDTGGRRNYC
jgi:hypothetical protein